MLQIQIRPIITRHSLVGIIGTAPFSYGNYFWMDNHYIVNMWMENLEHLLKTGVIKETDQLDAIKVGNKCFIIDQRIPKEFLNDKLCFNGCGGSLEEYQTLYQLAFGNSQNCYCNTQFNYVSFQRRLNRSNYSKGNCLCCGRELYLRNFNNTKYEITKEEFSILWEIKIQ